MCQNLAGLDPPPHPLGGGVGSALRKALDTVPMSKCLKMCANALALSEATKKEHTLDIEGMVLKSEKAHVEKFQGDK